MDRHYAIAIVGAGAAGCAIAIALAARGIEDVVVIDMAPQTGWRIGEAIPPAGRQALIELGVWEAFLADCHLPSAGSCASWGKPEVDYNDFLLDQQGKGWHLDRAAFDAMMAAAVSARGETLLRGLRLREVEAGEVYCLSFEREGGARLRISADFLVDATGIAASAVRRLKVARNQIDCLAVVSTVLDLQAPDAVPSQTLLEACEHGWWYAAKLPKDRMIVALAVEPCQRRRFGEIGAWTAALRQTLHVGSWVERGKAKFVDGRKVATVSAPSAILSRVVGDRWLAVGDAASAYDPISAQGIVKALRDGAAAGEAIAAYFASSGEAPLLTYQDGVFERFRNYLQLRRQLYQLERRWVQAPFWQNRMLLG